MRLAVLFLVLAGAAPAALQIEIHFSALERVLAREAFTQEGRRYVKGSEKTKCSFAYLEKPRFAGEYGRLRIETKFSGKSSMNLFGACVGLGDSFPLTILATPVWSGGRLRLKSVEASSPARPTLYVRNVLSRLTATLEKDFSYDIGAEAKRILEQPRDPDYKQQLETFTVEIVEITGRSVLLTIDLKLAVK